LEKNLLAVIPNLEGGGAERVMVWLCNTLCDEKGWDVELLTFSSPGRIPFYSVSKGVVLTQLGLSGSAGKFLAIGNFLRRVFAVRRKIKEVKGRVVLSFLDMNNVLVLLASIGLGRKVIVSERIDPEYQSFPRFGVMLRNLTYPLASGVVVQTQKVADSYLNRYLKQIRVIPNPIILKQSTKRCQKEKLILNVGRLHSQKGQDILLNAFARIQSEFPDWNLLILGEGENRDSLELEIDRLGLTDRVSIPGQAREVEAEFRKSSIFAFPSRFEGFPNALVEAMWIGLPCIAFKGVSGVDDLIDDGFSGILVDRESVECFSKALKQLMSNHELRESLGSHGMKKVKTMCCREAVVAVWEDTLLNQ